MKFDKILVLQQNALGDVVISTGVLKAIREQFPHSKLAFLVSPQTADLMKLPFIDELVIYDKGMPILPVVRQIWRYDVAICLDFKYRSAVLPFLARIPVRAGIAHKRKLFMTNAIERPNDSETMYFSYYMANVIRETIGLDLTHDATHLQVAPATVNDVASVDQVFAGLPIGKMNIAIAPFSSTTMKNWPVSYYEDFMAYFTKKYDCQFFILGGSSDCNRSFYIGDNVTDLRGALKLTATAELLRRMDYFVGSCSAPLHIATAVDRPVLAFYGPTSPAKWAPVHKCIHIEHPQACSPCDRAGYGSGCNGDNKCMKSITVAEGIQAMESLISQYPRN